MSTFFIDPCDLLVVRDGRPKADASMGQSLAFPFPQTVAGGVRTRVGSTPERGFVAGDQLDALKQVAIRGPVLASPEDGALYFPAPRDALLVRPPPSPGAADGAADTRLRRLVPLEADREALGDFEPGLLPVGLSRAEHEAAKPISPGAWWSWPLMEAWLRGDPDLQTTPAWTHGRRPPLLTEGRLHVRLDPQGTAVDGALFETRGLRLRLPAGKDHTSLDTAAFALWVEVDDATLPKGMALRDEVAPLGGERKLMHWSKAASATLPAIPAWLHSHVTCGELCDVRVVLATPAHFTAGARPDAAGTLLRSDAELTVQLRAMAVGRPEGYSGWDFAFPKGGRPKASERLVSAGSVFWLRLQGSAAAREAWLKRVWMQNVSDDPAHRRDGLGLALIGKGSV
jgi:CRISPR-associated protein Cmr3